VYVRRDHRHEVDLVDADSAKTLETVSLSIVASLAAERSVAQIAFILLVGSAT